MSNENRSPDDDLTAVEIALRGLVPARSQINRDLVMFRAGQASARSRFPQIVARNVLAASFALIALVEGAILAKGLPERVVERVVVVREPARVATPKPSASPVFSSVGIGRTAHEREVWQVLRYGLDGLPTPNFGGKFATSQRSLRDEIDQFLDTGDPS